jgi:Family of unknown function (DUF6117)
MALQEGDKANFQTLLRAAKAGNLTLVESKDAETGEYRAVLAAVAFDGKEYNITPFGHLCTGNPFEQYVDPVICMEQGDAA